MLHQQIEALKPWYQTLDFGDGVTTPGRWDATAQAQAINSWIDGGVSGKSLTDIGSNAGGVGFAMAKMGASKVHLVENSPLFHKQAELYINAVQPSGVEAHNMSGFKVHTLQQTKIYLWLGLIYHFRHPQLFLDYAASCGGKTHVISTQLMHEGKMSMRNRKAAFRDHKSPTMGWEPTTDMFAAMLETAGYTIVQMHATKWNEGWTNDCYAVCTPPEESQIDQAAVSCVLDAPGNWF
ncbi:hypothetical protein [Roseibium sp.]|uniref:hypothetical protein n=1 Tax=Roseibium sp. TaxID=1936156 RepID=UPI001B117428|nr:hypothetical protein [Roseibium sp.]MBO6858489.1 hypothetical protein [Roseibium sp.]